MGVEPTKLTACTIGLSSSVSTASLSPLTTLSTPGGRPASSASCASSRVEEGVFSDGLSTKVLPQTTASGHIHSGTMAGKLKGVMPATTPSGWNSLHESMAGPTFLVCSPLSNSGAPHANSTFSMPRCNSPSASLSTLPCSEVMSAQIWSDRSSSSCLKRYITRARLAGGVSRQAGKAAWALLMACSTVVLEARATRLVTRPWAGS